MVPTEGVKYEIDKHSGYLMVDRPQRFSSFCPTPYGFVTRTYCGDRVATYALAGSPLVSQGDGDPLYICKLTDRPILVCLPDVAPGVRSESGYFRNLSIVLIDLPPEALLKRLAEGKVYFQDTAARARESFFKPQNLATLRELALRRAAERVDADLVERMQAQAIEGPLPAGKRILACVGSAADASRHRAHRQAPGRPDGRAVDRRVR
jgi:hypothetical protein